MVVGEIKDGRPKSGRVWKAKQSCRSSAKLRTGVMSHLAMTFEEKERIREQKKYVKELESQMREEKQAEKVVLKQKRVEREKRKLENENKTSVYQNVSHHPFLLSPSHDFADQTRENEDYEQEAAEND
jgi:microsomal dipeptidase-like Zn-dependent dipeptidase